VDTEQARSERSECRKEHKSQNVAKIFAERKYISQHFETVRKYYGRKPMDFYYSIENICKKRFNGF